MDTTDKALAVEIKKGNSKAFKKLYDRYHKQLYYLAKNYLKDQNLARDAVQEVFLKFWNKRENLDHSSSVSGFLFVMLKNHLLNMMRDEHKRQKVIEEVKRMTANNEFANVVEEEIAYSEYKNIIENGLAKLSPAQKEVFELRSFEGLSNAEVAEKKHVSEHTVKTQYYLSSKFIRSHLKKHAGFGNIRDLSG
jgi:RNA polymerase sigma-70 factor (ECF subfamily)